MTTAKACAAIAAVASDGNSAAHYSRAIAAVADDGNSAAHSNHAITAAATDAYVAPPHRADAASANTCTV
jgi:hypothetical protein